MKLQEALQDTGLAEAWYDDGYTAIVAREGEGYRLLLQQGSNPPYFTHDGFSIEQIEGHVNTTHPLDWHPVELEG